MIHLLVIRAEPVADRRAIDPAQAGSPGFLGFVFTFLVAIAALFLFLSLTKQMRRVDRRSKRLGLDEDKGDPFADDDARPTWTWA